MTTVQQILNQNDNYSELSIDASFTLQDILLQPPDQELAIYNNLQQIDDFDAFFEDDQPAGEMNQAPSEKNESQKPIGSSQMIKIPQIGQQRQKSSIQQKNKPKQIRRWARLSDLPLPSSQNIRNMVYIALKNVSQVFDIANSATKGVGVPTCISSTGSKFLAIGTSIGNIVVFQIGVKGNRNLSTPDQNKYGQVTSISVSRDNRYLVAGYETGLVILWDLYGFKLVKTILLQKNRILKVLFCSQNYQNFISSDSQGYLYIYTIQNYLWTGVKTQLLVDRSQNVYYGLKYSKLKSGKSILALSTFNSILLVILKPTITVLGSIQRPQNIGSNTIPNCQIGPSQQNTHQRNSNNDILKQAQIKKQDYLCVSWGKYIYIYMLISQKNQNQRIQLNFIIEQPSGIHNMEFITNGILVTLDKRQVYRVINLLSQKLKLKDKDNNSNNTVVGDHISVAQLQAQTIYQRYLKDKQGKYLKCYSNTIVSCSYNPRYKEIFLISKNAVYRGRLQKWTDYIHYLLTQVQNWQLALKLCLQLYRGKYNIFAEPFVVSKTTVSLLCDIGKIFFKQRMKELQKKRTQQNSIKQVVIQAKQLFEITIQFFCSFGCEDFMFENIYKNLRQKYFFQYEQLFIQSLQPFIEESMLHKIPNREIFLHIIDTYSKKPQILNKLIIGLHQDCIYFSDIVEICTKQKLFESLSYICSVNSDFISPANKIIAHLQQFPNDTVQYSYLKDYLSKLTDLKYPNGKQVGKDKESMLRDLSIWLGCDQTLHYMVKRYPDDYFQILSKLAKRLLENDLLNEIPIFVEQVISRLDIIRQKKLLPKFLQFVVEVGLSQKIHYSQDVLRKVLDVCVQMYENYNSMEFNKQFKYVRLLRFIEKYLLDKHQNIKSIRDQFNIKLLSKVNIWVRIIYKMISGIDRDQLLQQSPQLLRNQDPGRDATIQYLFDNSQKYKQIIDKYEDLLIQFSPQQSLLYIIKDRKNTGVRQINKYIMKIEDQKLRYAVARKILRLYRLKNKQFLNQPMDQTAQILKQSIKLLNPTFMIIADNLVETHTSEQLLLFYLSSLCKYKKQKRVFYQLIQNQFQYRPIVTKLENIIEKYNYRSCMGFIYEQKLKLKQAFIQYQYVYQQYFNENFKKLVSHQHCHGRFMARIFHIMLDLCFKIKKQQQWGLLISSILSPLLKPDFTSRHQNTKIIDTIQTIYEKKSSKQHPFMQQLIDVIELTLISMSREVSIDLMAVQLNKYTELLNKTFIVNCLISTLKGCQKRVQTYQISKQMMIFDFVTQFEQFFRKNKLNGSPTDEICDQCGLQASSRSYNPNIQQIKFEVLKCGHGYHDKCFEKNHFKCKVCTQNAYGDVISDQIVKQQKIKLGQNIMENQQRQQQEDDQKKVYQYLALQQYRRTQQQNFLKFIQQYEGYITNSKNL